MTTNDNIEKAARECAEKCARQLIDLAESSEDAVDLLTPIILAAMRGVVEPAKPFDVEAFKEAVCDKAGLAVGNEHRTYTPDERVQMLPDLKLFFARRYDEVSKENAELRESLKLSYTETEKQLSRIVLALQEQVRVLREHTETLLTWKCTCNHPACKRCRYQKKAEEFLVATTEPAEGKAD